MLAALLCFALLDATSKHLSQTFNVPLLVWARYTVHCLLMLVFLGPSLGTRLVATSRPVAQVLRALLLVGVTGFAMAAFRVMPLAETTALLFVTPLIVALLAGPFLGERVGKARWLAALVGFAGTLLIARPGGALALDGVLYTTIAAICYSVLPDSNPQDGGNRKAAHHGLLHGTGGHGGHVAGPALDMDRPGAGPPANGDGLLIGDLWWHRPLPAHIRVPPCAGIDPRTVSIRPIDLGRAAWMARSTTSGPMRFPLPAWPSSWPAASPLPSWSGPVRVESIRIRIRREKGTRHGLRVAPRCGNRPQRIGRAGRGYWWRRSHGAADTGRPSLLRHRDQPRRRHPCRQCLVRRLLPATRPDGGNPLDGRRRRAGRGRSGALRNRSRTPARC